MILLGIDLIIKNNDFNVIDVNANPSGLAEADALREILKNNSTDKVAKRLICEAQGKIVLIILPDWCKIENGFTDKYLKQKNDNIDDMLNSSLHDVNLVAKAIREYGVCCFISNYESIMMHKDALFSPDKIGIIWNRGHHYFENLGYLESNDIRMRALCRSKLELSKRLNKSWMVPLNSLENKKDNVQKVKNEEWIIIKPDRGYGSYGIKRISRKEFISHLQSFSTSSLRYGWQPWIPPSTFQSENLMDYFYDVRAFILDGDLIGLFARKCVIPANSKLESPLVWLTTLGSNLKITIEDSKTKHTPTLSQYNICQLKEICSDLCDAIRKEYELENKKKVAQEYYDKAILLNIPDGADYNLVEYDL